MLFSDLTAVSKSKNRLKGSICISCCVSYFMQTSCKCNQTWLTPVKCSFYKLLSVQLHQFYWTVCVWKSTTFFSLTRRKHTWQLSDTTDELATPPVLWFSIHVRLGLHQRRKHGVEHRYMQVEKHYQVCIFPIFLTNFQHSCQVWAGVIES